MSLFIMLTTQDVQHQSTLLLYEKDDSLNRMSKVYGLNVIYTRAHYRKILLCRAPTSLPSAVEEALGKDGPLPSATSDARQRALCRVPKAGGRQIFPLSRATRSAKVSSRQSPWPANGGGYRPLCRDPNVRHSAKDGSLTSASWQGARQNLLCRVSYVALGKAFLFFCFFI
jgi:hypothetical protein